ncbi:helix-turn-helix domain-containing protein [Aurantimonas aggregata]|uniref:Helix-turn-helix domain-containing protein n=1 Tax=Aurantimonas aggregata TaxID=2047720 RepID=A0A6L9MFU9_9HYPH|nr:helix-turn-helix transcriptional regulator [Aurantimonas aggregata]NDV86683.1 helix-turn-helix domain-containing protein [Aurantimonas aggregata]
MNEAVNLKGESLIVMTRAEYEDLIEDSGDIALIRQAEIDYPDAPAMPAEIAEQIWNEGLHPLAGWRKSLGMTQAELAAKAGVRAASVSDIESRKIDPRLSTLKALAAALKLGIEDIVD